MPPRPEPTARSFSRSSKRSEPPAFDGDRATLAVGVVAGAHALKGMLRVRAYHLPAPSLTAGRAIFLERNGVVKETRVVSAAPHGRGLILLGVEGIADRDAAEATIGARVLVLQADLPPPDDGEFYYHELEGFAVVTTDGQALGSIVETFTTGTNDVWVVRDRREYLIPVIADVVRSIDRDGRRVVIEPLPGLLE